MLNPPLGELVLHDGNEAVLTQSLPTNAGETVPANDCELLEINAFPAESDEIDSR